MAAAWGSGATQEAGEPSDSSRASGQGKTPLDSWGVGQQRPPGSHEQSGVLPYSLWVTSYLGCPRTLKMPFFKKLRVIGGGHFWNQPPPFSVSASLTHMNTFS